jgi:hypothetical protein
VLFRCYAGGAEQARMRAAFGTEENCKAILLKPQVRPSGPFAAQRDAVERGEARVDPNRSARCVAEGVAACSPDLDLTASDTCRHAVVGAGKVGGACFSDVACEFGAYCDQSGNSCPGVCKTAKAEGEACSRDTECATRASTGARCADDGSGNGTCRIVDAASTAAEGEPCGTTELARCATNLFCDTGETPATCRVPPPPGTACVDVDDVCQGGAVCAGNEGSRTCMTLTLVKTEGAPCEGTPEAPSLCDVFGGYSCDAGTCRKMGDGSLGTLCDTSDMGDLASCNTGLYCRQETMTCEARAGDGDACDRDAMCESGSCDREKGSCRSRYCER